jgi:hypothetical protein
MTDKFREVSVGIPRRQDLPARMWIDAIEERFKSQLADEAIRAWEQAGARGAFCAAACVPEQASASVSALGNTGKNDYRWTIQLASCDNRSLLVLANLLLGLTYQQQASSEGMLSDKLWCRRIEIDGSGEERELYDFRDLVSFEKRMYPSLTEVIRSKVFIQGSSSRSFRRMLLEFRGSAEEQFGLIENATGLWGKVVENGYPQTLEDLYNGHCFIGGIKVDLFDAYSLEVKVQSFGGTESAWNPLLNMLAVVRNEIIRVSVY